MHQRRTLTALTVALAALAAGQRPATAGAEGPTVTIGVFQFGPDSLTVSAGTAVTWLNGDEIAHTVRADDPDAPGAWAEVELEGRGARGRVVLNRPGTFSYHCGRHPGMRGVVHVTRRTESGS